VGEKIREKKKEEEVGVVAASENNYRIVQGRVVILCVYVIVSKLTNFAEHFKNFTPI
jgi:hypothetical protein